MARPIATDYGGGIFTDSQTWSATVASTGETTLGNIVVPVDEQWNIYSIWCQGTGGEYRLDCTGAAATADMFEFSGIGTIGSTIKLVSQDETAKTYICVADDTGGSNGTVTDGKVEFEAGAATAAHAAAHFKIAVEHANGHNGEINVGVSTAEVTLTQNTVGEAGNRLITPSPSFGESIVGDFTGIPYAFTGGSDGLSDLVGKFIQNGDGDTTKQNALFNTDIWIVGPCTLTMYVTNNDATSTVCKGLIQYIRHTSATHQTTYGDIGEVTIDG